MGNSPPKPPAPTYSYNSYPTRQSSWETVHHPAPAPIRTTIKKSTTTTMGSNTSTQSTYAQNSRPTYNSNPYRYTETMSSSSAGRSGSSVQSKPFQQTGSSNLNELKNETPLTVGSRPTTPAPKPIPSPAPRTTIKTMQQKQNEQDAIRVIDHFNIKCEQLENSQSKQSEVMTEIEKMQKECKELMTKQIKEKIARSKTKLLLTTRLDAQEQIATDIMQNALKTSEDRVALIEHKAQQRNQTCNPDHFKEKVLKLSNKFESIQMELESGVAIWRISNFRALQPISDEKLWSDWQVSQPFYTGNHNYKFQVFIRVTCNGAISFRFEIVPGEFDDTLTFPFRGKVVVCVTNKMKKYVRPYQIEDLSMTTTDEQFCSIERLDQMKLIDKENDAVTLRISVYPTTGKI